MLKKKRKIDISMTTLEPGWDAPGVGGEAAKVQLSGPSSLPHMLASKKTRPGALRALLAGSGSGCAMGSGTGPLLRALVRHCLRDDEEENPASRLLAYAVARQCCGGTGSLAAADAEGERLGAGLASLAAAAAKDAPSDLGDEVTLCALHVLASLPPRVLVSFVIAGAGGSSFDAVSKSCVESESPAVRAATAECFPVICARALLAVVPSDGAWCPGVVAAAASGSGPIRS